MKTEIELLKMCADIFEKMNKVSWNENSIWNENNYYETERKVSNFLKDNMCDCEPFHSCQKCSESTYRKAMEEINGIISQVEGQEDCNISEMDRHLAADHDQMLKDIYLITHRDFRQPKTEWLPLSEMKPGVEYWILDKNNIIGRARMNNGYLIEYDLNVTPGKFDKPVMFAEIKPPQAPGS